MYVLKKLCSDDHALASDHELHLATLLYPSFEQWFLFGGGGIHHVSGILWDSRESVLLSHYWRQGPCPHGVCVLMGRTSRKPNYRSTCKYMWAVCDKVISPVLEVWLQGTTEQDIQLGRAGRQQGEGQRTLPAGSDI